MHDKIYLVIDDDPINNTICKMVIKKTIGQVDVQTFTQPEEGLAFIQNTFSDQNIVKEAVLFLDINMPSMTGWDVLEQFDLMEEAAKKRVKIYILSSSVDGRDMERAQNDPYVVDYIIKPLSKDTILKIMSDS